MSIADEWVERRPGRGRCAVAAKDLQAGCVISRFSGQPYASCPLPSERERRCAGCLQAAEADAKLLRCGKCKWARYCSRACQQKDWPLHKRECAGLATDPLRSLPDAPLSDVLLAGRCLWRRHAASKDPTREDVAFDEMERAPDGAPASASPVLGLQVEDRYAPRSKAVDTGSQPNETKGTRSEATI